MVQKITLNQLKEYAARKARLVTDDRYKVSLVNRLHGHKDTVARSYVIQFVPKDKAKSVVTIRREIELKRSYYNQNRSDPRELKQCVLHEVAHSVSTRHDSRFRSAARKLGVDANHQKKSWK
jgi:hypothetical protein